MDPGDARERCSAQHRSDRSAAQPTPRRGRRRRLRHAQPQSAHRHPGSAAPYLDRKVREVPDLAEVWSYINPFMLYGRHLGYKGNFEQALAAAR